MATGAVNPALLISGPGIIYRADLGSAEPSHTVAAGKFSTAPWGGPWRALGSTDDGHDFRDAPSVEGIEVAESYYDVRRVTTGREASWSTALAEINLSNLRVGLNGGTSTVVSAVAGTEMTRVAPPTVGGENRSMIGWQSEDDQVRLIGYQVINVGDLSLSFKKGAAKATISIEWFFEKPAGDPYAIFLAGAGRVS